MIPWKNPIENLSRRAIYEGFPQWDSPMEDFFQGIPNIPRKNIPNDFNSAENFP